MPQVIKKLNKQEFDLKDLSMLVEDMFAIKMKSPKLFEYFVAYFIQQKYTVRDLALLPHTHAINLIHGIAYCHGELNNQEFFNIVR